MIFKQGDGEMICFEHIYTPGGRGSLYLEVEISSLGVPSSSQAVSSIINPSSILSLTRNTKYKQIIDI